MAVISELLQVIAVPDQNPRLGSPTVRGKNLSKGNLSGKARRTLILDHASETGLLNMLLAHFDFDQVLRYEDFFHPGPILQVSRLLQPGETSPWVSTPQ